MKKCVYIWGYKLDFFKSALLVILTVCLVFFTRYYANQKKTLEVNPRHPLVKELLKRVETDKEDKTAKDLARVLFETATLRSGYLIKVSLTL